MSIYGLGETNPEAKLLLPRLRAHMTPFTDPKLGSEEYAQQSQERYKDLCGMVYLLEIRCGRSFARRETLERMLWERLLCANEEDTEFAGELRKVMLESCGRSVWPCMEKSSEALWDDIKSTPMIFLSIPWVPPFAAEEAKELAKDIGLADWELEEGPLFHDRPEGEHGQLDFARKQRQQFYPVSVYLPAILATSQRVRELLDRLMCSMLYSLAWYRPQEVQDEGLAWWAEKSPGEYAGRWVLQMATRS
jgi:hypothetical protein